MNILSVLRAELSPTGEFVPCPRVQTHLNEILKTQDGDLLRIGVVGGQKGMAQVHVQSSSKDKRGRIHVVYKVQLLPLCFQNPREAIIYSNDVTGREQKPDITSEDGGDGVRDKESARADPRFGKVRDDRYKFGSLEPSQLEPWLIHPYTPGETNLPTEKAIIDQCGAVPRTIKILRTTQPRIDIFMALPRPKLLDKILQYVASMSIGRVHFFASSRSDRSYFSSTRLRESNISESIRLGLEQGMRTTAAPVTVSASLKTALMLAKQFYADQASDEIRTLIAHPYPVGGEGARPADQLPLTDATETSIARLKELFAASSATFPVEGIRPSHMMSTELTESKGVIILVLGPEGGFTEGEVCTILTEMPQASLVTLGQDILRCEVALLSMIAQTQMLITATGEEGKGRKYNPALNEGSIFISPPGRKKARLESEGTSEPLTIESQSNISAEPAN